MTVQVMQPAPDFALQGYDRASDSFKDYKLEDFKGKWVCLFFYPLDFTFVCPTELIAFNESLGEFESRNCQVLTASTDSKYSHKGWCDADPQLGGLKYPMLADGTHKLSPRLRRAQRRRWYRAAWYFPDRPNRSLLMAGHSRFERRTKRRRSAACSRCPPDRRKRSL